MTIFPPVSANFLEFKDTVSHGLYGSTKSNKVLPLWQLLPLALFLEAATAAVAVALRAAVL